MNAILAALIELAVLPNSAGGLISLDSALCATGGLQVSSTAPYARTIYGCWDTAGEHVVIRWDDGRVSLFRSADFIVNTSNAERMLNNTPWPGSNSGY